MQYFFFPLCIFSVLRQGLPPAPGRKNRRAGFHFSVVSSPGKWKAAGKTGPSFSSRLPLGAGVPGLQPALLWGARLPSDHSPRASLRGVPRKAPPFYSESRPIPGRGPGGKARTGRRGGFFRRVCSCSAGKTVRPEAGQVLLLPAGEEGAFCASGPGQRLLNSFSPESPFSLPPKKGFSACALLYLL